MKLLQCRAERSHSKETSALYASSYPTPPAIPPTGPLMSEKPAFFPEESEAAIIATATPPTHSKKKTLSMVTKEKAGKRGRGGEIVQNGEGGGV
ncbi:hypothetical protein NQZ68_033198 [Dissostichus eleginoides]|nr:hypothetical protein NQZ68_033198 [Dissostichus eleginoides]